MDGCRRDREQVKGWFGDRVGGQGAVCMGRRQRRRYGKAAWEYLKAERKRGWHPLRLLGVESFEGK